MRERCLPPPYVPLADAAEDLVLAMARELEAEGNCDLGYQLLQEWNQFYLRLYRAEEERRARTRKEGR